MEILNEWYEVYGLAETVRYPSSGKIAVEKDTGLVLYEDKTYQMFQWGKSANEIAYKFESPELAIMAAKHNIGKPWYFIPYKLEVYKKTRKVTETLNFVECVLINEEHG